MDKSETNPPPIFVAGIANVISLTIELLKNGYDIKVASSIQVKIQAKTFVKYART
jgi:hypothetical protein